MTNVTGLAQHILTLEPAQNAARLCFYHYLKNMCDPQEPVSCDLLVSFYSRALAFSHWQVNKSQLFTETQACMVHYAESHPAEGDGLLAVLQDLWQPDQVQVVRLESQTNLVAIIERTLEAENTAAQNAAAYVPDSASAPEQASHVPLDQWRVLPEGDDRAIVIALTEHKGLEVTVYPPLAKIVTGELTPLCRDYTLRYGPDLLLTNGALQQLDVGSHTTARFRFSEDGCRGLLIRGYTFQKYAAMEGGSLHRHPILFYPLKRLEQYFIHRKTDPMYIELTGILEKAADLLNQGHPEGVKFGTQALERGKLALEQIFPDDKMVRLLINNLEKSLALEAADYEVVNEKRKETQSDPGRIRATKNEESWPLHPTQKELR